MHGTLTTILVPYIVNRAIQRTKNLNFRCVEYKIFLTPEECIKYFFFYQINRVFHIHKQCA